MIYKIVMGIVPAMLTRYLFPETVNSLKTVAHSYADSQ